MATHATPRWTFEQYFAWEAEQPIRHEFIDGEVYAMTGGSLRHSRTNLRLASLLDQALRGRCCVAFQGDAKLEVEATGSSYYPDAFVCCDPSAMQERGVVTDATAIFEVLSPGTATFDRGGKFDAYRLLPSLVHYVLIDPEALSVQTFERIGGVWTIVERDGDAIRLQAIDVTLSQRDLFDGLGEARPAIGHPTKTILPPD